MRDLTADILNAIREQGYTLDHINTHGRITSPGKFENEHIFTLYFWQQVLNGYGEYLCDGRVAFELEPEEVQFFNVALIEPAVCFLLITTDSGFVLGGFTGRTMEELQAEYADSTEEI